MQNQITVCAVLLKCDGGDSACIARIPFPNVHKKTEWQIGGNVADDSHEDVFACPYRVIFHSYWACTPLTLFCLLLSIYTTSRHCPALTVVGTWLQPSSTQLTAAAVLDAFTASLIQFSCITSLVLGQCQQQKQPQLKMMLDDAYKYSACIRARQR